MFDRHSHRRLACGAVLSVVGSVALTSCATPLPSAPSIVALPRSGETYASFRQHDDYCRATAAYDTGASPGQAAQNQQFGSAVVGTGLGAAAGALIGSASHSAGAGAAIGAGTGLLFGSAVGEGSGYHAAAQVQRRYNTVYAQCMIAYGERIAPPPRPYPRPYVYRVYPYPPPPPPPAFIAPY